VGIGRPALHRITNKLLQWLRHRYLPWHLAIVAMVLCIPSLWLGWKTDDYIHRAALIGVPELPEVPRLPVAKPNDDYRSHRPLLQPPPGTPFSPLSAGAPSLAVADRFEYKGVGPPGCC
jgi:hypothetical protein